MTETEAMSDEFDLMATWTADAVLELGPEHAIPAGCRGSGTPAALRWLGRQLQLASDHVLLDAGAGVGGAAELLAGDFGVEVVLAEPMFGACQAAVRLFERPTVRADAAQLPFATGVFDAVSCLGVLCTMADQPGLLAELRRVLKPGGRAGLLVFLRTVPTLDRQPDGNHFPDRGELDQLLTRAGLNTLAEADLSDFEAAPADWTHALDEVDRVIERDHGDDQRYQVAAEQQAIIGGLLKDELVIGRLLIVAADASS